MEYDGWTEREINEEIARLLKECSTEEQRNLLLELAAEARASGYSWPLRPKMPEPPPLYVSKKHGC